jgi:hypothetical protein
LKTAAAESIITSTTTARIEDETTSPQPLITRPETQVRFPSTFLRVHRNESAPRAGDVLRMKALNVTDERSGFYTIEFISIDCRSVH